MTPLNWSDRDLFWKEVVPFFALDESFDWDSWPDLQRDWIKSWEDSE